MNYVPNISPEEIKMLPAAAFEGQIVIVDDESQLKEACDYLLSQKVIGFDTETKPSFQVGQTNKVALIQLSTADRCYLFRLCRMRSTRQS